MAETAALLGYGTLFEISEDNGATWTELAEVFDITPPNDEVDEVDATHMRSPSKTREFIPGLIDPGEASFEMNFIPGSPSDAKVRALKIAGTRVKCKITFPNAVEWVFSAWVRGYEPAVPTDDKMTSTVTWRVTGPTISTDGAAPVNALKPAISGTAQVGQVLTAWPGTWSGAPIFSYQWKKGGVNIAGATDASYTPVVGDVGGAITVAVTATNSEGSTTVTSAATVNVIAA